MPASTADKQIFNAQWKVRRTTLNTTLASIDKKKNFSVPKGRARARVKRIILVAVTLHKQQRLDTLGSAAFQAKLQGKTVAKRKEIIIELAGKHGMSWTRKYGKGLFGTPGFSPDKVVDMIESQMQSGTKLETQFGKQFPDKVDQIRATSPRGAAPPSQDEEKDSPGELVREWKNFVAAFGFKIRSLFPGDMVADKVRELEGNALGVTKRIEDGQLGADKVKQAIAQYTSHFETEAAQIRREQTKPPPRRPAADVEAPSVVGWNRLVSDVLGRLNKFMGAKKLDSQRATNLKEQLQDYLNRIDATLTYENQKRHTKTTINEIFGRYKGVMPRITSIAYNAKLDVVARIPKGRRPVAARKPAPKPSPRRRVPRPSGPVVSQQSIFDDAMRKFEVIAAKRKLGSDLRKTFRDELKREISNAKSIPNAIAAVQNSFDALKGYSPALAKPTLAPLVPSPLKLPKAKAKLPKPKAKHMVMPKAMPVIRVPARIPLPRRFLPQRYKLQSGPPSKAVGFRLHADAKKKVVRKGGTITQLRKKLVAYRKKLWSKQLIKLTGVSAAQIRKLYQTFIIGQKPSFYLNPVVRGLPKEKRKKIIEGAEVKLFPAKRTKRRRKRGGGVTGCHFNDSGTISGCRFTL